MILEETEPNLFVEILLILTNSQRPLISTEIIYSLGKMTVFVKFPAYGRKLIRFQEVNASCRLERVRAASDSRKS